jgi:hypothetical protein
MGIFMERAQAQTKKKEGKWEDNDRFLVGFAGQNAWRASCLEHDGGGGGGGCFRNPPDSTRRIYIIGRRIRRKLKRVKETNIFWRKIKNVGGNYAFDT